MPELRTMPDLRATPGPSTEDTALVEPLRPGEAAELVEAALAIRLRHLASPVSLGQRGERDIAVVVGILIDKRPGILQKAPEDAGGMVEGLDEAVATALERAG